MNPKVFAIATALGGGCVGLSLYFWPQGNTVEATTQSATSVAVPPIKVTAKEDSQEPRSVAKGKCEVTATPKEIEEFLGKKQADKDNYVAFTCSNTDVKNSYIPLPDGWIGLFPKSFLDAQFSATAGTTFELQTQVKQEESDLGSIEEATFSGSSLKNSKVVGEWDGRGEEKLQDKSAVSVTVGGRWQRKNVIYLLLPSSSTTNEIPSQ